MGRQPCGTHSLLCVCICCCTCAEARLRAALWCCSSRLLSWSRSFPRAWPVDRPRVTESSSCSKTHIVILCLNNVYTPKSAKYTGAYKTILTLSTEVNPWDYIHIAGIEHFISDINLTNQTYNTFIH